MRKKITLIFLGLIMSLSFVLTGCDLFPRNLEEYLNKPVVTLNYHNGDVEKITTEAFISAFNSYGSSLVSNGSSYDEAREQTIEVLISRYIMLHEAKNVITLTEKDNKLVLNDVYESLVSNLKQFETSVRTDWDIKEPTDMGADTEEVVVYTPFEHIAEVVFENGQYKIKLLDVDNAKDTKNFANIDSVIAAFNAFANPAGNEKENEVTKEAYRRYIATLKANEQGLNKTTDTASVLKRQVEKVFKNVEENKYITLLEKYYKSDENYSTISVKQVLDKYRQMIIESKFKFESDNDAHTTTMLDSFADMNYAVNDNFFFVSHILLKFSAEQQAEYNAIESDAYMSFAQKKKKTDDLILQIQGQARDNEGKFVEGSEVFATKLLSDLQIELNACKTEQQKIDVFKTYLYKYNQDGGIMNAEYNYVIGTEDSRMVESFTEASRELNAAGEFGAISKLVPSEYGVHIIFYAGKVQNLFTVNDIATFTLVEDDILTLTNAKLSSFNNKTVFDKVFGMLSNDNYSIFENMNLNTLKSKVDIVKHPNVYNNL